MTSFLSTISSQFAKHILIGTIFPVVLFVTILTAVVLPAAGLNPKLIVGMITPWQDSIASGFTIFVILLSVLMFALNTALIRLYEGYPWKDSFLGCWATRHQREKAALLQQFRERARLLMRQAHEANAMGALPKDFLELLSRSSQERASFPLKESSILPTRLGNVIRAFEGYPKIRYGIDAIMLWPRLVQKLPKEVLDSLDSSKASFDFMLNCSVLSVVSALAVMTTTAIHHSAFHRPFIGIWTALTALFFGLAYFFYLGAINRAASWGTEVKVAFDLYRLDLLSSLGYKVEIAGPNEERALWEEISHQLLFPDAPNLKSLPYKTEQTAISIVPASVVVTVKRNLSWSYGQIVVSIEVKNEDLFRHNATSIQITDRIPQGHRVVENSVKVEGISATVHGIDALIVSIGSLGPGSTKQLKYKLRKAER